MLTKENKKAIDELIDQCTPFGGLVEFGLDLATPILTSQLDSRVLDRINPQYHNIINEIITHVLIEKDYTLAKQKTAILLSDIIDTPLIDGDPEEIQAYNGLLDFLQIVIEGLIAKKNEPSEDD